MLFLIRHSSGQSFIGHYEYNHPYLLINASIDFYKDGSYKYIQTGDRHMVSVGTWRFKNRTLYLKDSLEGGFDIKVRESIDSAKSEIIFNSVTYRNNDTEYQARIVVNDTSSGCTVDYGTCVFPGGSVRKFKVYVRELFSKPYVIHSRQSNIFDIVIVKDNMPSYFILKGEKFYVKDKDTLLFFGNPMEAKVYDTFKRVSGK
jgi:hypothetical protein